MFLESPSGSWYEFFLLSRFGQEPKKMSPQNEAIDAVSCFLLTDIRMVEAAPRSVLIDIISGRNLRLNMAQPPQPGALVEVNLGDMGWVDGVVRWTGGTQVSVELQRNIKPSALLDQEGNGYDADEQGASDPLSN